MTEKQLSGQTALITGASRGIGAATARLFAQNGISRLILHYNSNAFFQPSFLCSSINCVLLYKYRSLLFLLLLC